MSKTDKLVFFGRGRKFFLFSYKARIFHLKLNKILDETVEYRNFMPSLRPKAGKV